MKEKGIWKIKKALDTLQKIDIFEVKKCFVYSIYAFLAIFLFKIVDATNFLFLWLIIAILLLIIALYRYIKFQNAYQLIIKIYGYKKVSKGCESLFINKCIKQAIDDVKEHYKYNYKYNYNYNKICSNIGVNKEKY